jgi:hypothetical protein
VARLAAQWAIIDSFSTIVVQSLRFTIENSSTAIAIVVVPSRLVAEGNDLLPTVPAGLYFSYTDFLEYDFRMTVGNLFLRIRGVYRSETELVGRMLAALKDPRSVLMASDPAYFYAKIDQLEKNLTLLAGKVSALDESLAALTLAHGQLSESHEQLSKSHGQLSESYTELAREYAALEAAGTELARKNEAAHEALSSSLQASVDKLGRTDEELARADGKLAEKDESLTRQTEELAKENAQSAAEFEALRYASLYFENVEWLFFKKEVPREGTARVVELKKATPAMTLKELSAQLKSEGIKITDQGITLVLQVFFNEF